MPGRQFVGATGYSYGFGGQLKDDEITGNGNSYTAEYWQYDNRLGRRWNVDPIVKPWESSYAAFSNNPIWFIDPLGLDTIPVSQVDMKTFDVNKDKIELPEIEVGAELQKPMIASDATKVEMPNPYSKMGSSIEESNNSLRFNITTGKLGIKIGKVGFTGDFSSKTLYSINLNPLQDDFLSGNKTSSTPQNGWEFSYGVGSIGESEETTTQTYYDKFGEWEKKTTNKKTTGSITLLTRTKSKQIIEVSKKNSKFGTSDRK